MQNRLIFLEDSRKRAISTGNMEQLELIDKDIISTQITINELTDLLSK